MVLSRWRFNINYVGLKSEAQHLISSIVMDLRGRTDFVLS